MVLPALAAASAGFSIFSALGKKGFLEEQGQTQKKFQTEGLFQTVEALNAQRFEQGIDLANQRDSFERNAALGINLFRTSAFASGVEGRSVDALTHTKLIEEAEVKAQFARRLKALDANLSRQTTAARTQALFSLTQALQELKSQATSPYEILGGITNNAIVLGK